MVVAGPLKPNLTLAAQPLQEKPGQPVSTPRSYDEGKEASSNPGWDLMHRVDSAIRQNPHLAGHQVFCQHEQGIVVLHGRVKSFFQKQMAQESLKRLEGVEKVINELEVEWLAAPRMERLSPGIHSTR